MKKLLLTAFLIVFTSSLFAQVGIGTDMPNPSSLLDIYVKAGDKGVLLTRVALTGTTDNTTITPGNVESLLVYNTATVADVTPGYYYWHHQQWNRILTPADISAATNTTNTSLTTDGVDLILTDSEGNFVSIPLSSLFTETVTSLVDNGDGTLTYTDETGNTNNIDVAQIIANNETVTTLSNQGDGTYIYTNEDGTKTTIDIPADVLAEIQDNTSTIYSEIVNLIKTKQTLTSMTQEDNTGIITYVDEDGGTPSTAEVISTDTDNLISVGNDGGAFLKAEDLNYLTTNAIKTVNTDYNAKPTDAILLVDAASGDVVITLPAATAYKGKKYTIKKQDTNETNTVTVQGELTGSLTELYNALPYSGWELVSNGTEWIIVNKF